MLIFCTFHRVLDPHLFSDILSSTPKWAQPLWTPEMVGYQDSTVLSITVTGVMSADLLHNIFLFVFPIFLPDFHSSTFLFCFSHSHQIHLVLFHEFFSLQVSFGSHASEKISTFIWKSYWKYYAASFIDNLKGFQNWLQK